MLKKNFSSWPSFTEEETNAVHDVLLSNKVNYWTGQEVRTFESEFAEWVNAKYAIALSNGTVALDVALKALDLAQGDEVVVTPRSFIASVSCVVNAGATPKFADVDKESGNLSAESIAKVLSPHTKAIICVHLAGWPCEMDPIMQLAEQHNIYVIEDCAQSHGGQYNGRSLGSIGHVGAWSFCQDKIMTTGGEGGMVTCNDKTLWRKMWSYKDHGKKYTPGYEFENSPKSPWSHESFGTNCRMTEMQAAIGRIQIKRMSDWSMARIANAMAIREALLPFSGEGGVVRVPTLNGEGNLHAYYKYYTYVRPENFASGWTRDRVVDEINRLGVPCYRGSCSEIYLEKAFDGTNFRPKKRLPIAKKLGETSLMFVVHPTLTEREIDLTCIVIRDVLTKASC